MRLLRLSLAATCMLAVSFSAARAASPAQPASPGIAPADARHVLEILRDPKASADLATTLETIARAAPVTAATAASAPVAAATPPSLDGKAAAEATAAEKPAEKPDAAPALAPNSLGARLLVGASETINRTTAEVKAGAAAIKSLPSLAVWFETMATDPLARETIIDVAWRLAVAVAAALGVEWLLWRALARPRAMLAAMAPRAPALVAATGPVDENEESAESDEDARGETAAVARSRRATAWTLLRRLPLVLGMLALDLLPIAAFAVTGHILAATGLGHTNFMRLVLLGVVQAYALSGVVLAVGRMLLSPSFPRLRLLHWSDASAAYGLRWLRRIVVVFVSGNAIAEVGLLFGMTTAAHDALIKAAGFVVHVMLAIVVWQKRKSVAAALRAKPGSPGALASARSRFAAIWHWIALFYIAAIWFVWAVEIQDGYGRMLNVFITTLGVIVGARLLTIVALGALDRGLHVRASVAERLPGLDRRARFYHPILRGLLVAAMWLIALAVLFQLWGFGVLAWLVGTALGLSVLGALATILVTFVLALAVWEAANIGIELHLAKLASEAQAARSARLRTLLPLLRTLLLGAILIVTVLMVLSQIGVNIAPLLAGAGILGVAIGFGSQKLVQDLITGIFLLLENAMQVGDWVTVSGLSGTVENLSVRTIRLRAADGSVHIIPFSAVTSVTNTNRGLGNASVSVTVPFSEDTDRVGALLTEMVEEMRGEPDYAVKMLSPLQLWGVDKVDGSSATLLGQIVCTDAGRWAVQREFNRRLKLRFQSEGIHIYNPAQQFVLEQVPVAANAPPLRQAGE